MAFTKARNVAENSKRLFCCIVNLSRSHKIYLENDEAYFYYALLIYERRLEILEKIGHQFLCQYIKFISSIFKECS